MSFRQFGGLQFASKHNAVSSYYNTSNNLLVTQNVGQPNSYINFLSDISGNISIYGNLDVSGNVNVAGDLDISGNLHVQGDFDISGNLYLDGDVDISGNLHVQEDIDCSGNITSEYMFLSSGTNYTTSSNGVVPKSYVDAISSGLRPLPYCVLCSNDSVIDLSGNTQTIDGVTLDSSYNGEAILVNAQGGNNTTANSDNGIYIVGDGPWSRSPYLIQGDLATGTSTVILNGNKYSNHEFVCISGTQQNPAFIGDPVIWTIRNVPYSLGEGLSRTFVNNQTVISVDSSLNFIQYLDNTNGPNPDTIYIGTNTNTVNIGKTTTTTVISGNVGIGTNSPAYTLDVSGNTNISSTLNVGPTTSQLLTNAQLKIYETTGTGPYTQSTPGDTPTNSGSPSGSLVISHNNSGGYSSIVFPSNVNNTGGDYAYIQYFDNVSAGYPGSTNETGLLLIGIENDSVVGSGPDRISLYSCGGNGYVGINTLYPNYTLDVNGSVNATSYNSSSDYRIKENVAQLDSKFVVDNLNPVTYLNNNLGKQDIGLIAHELQEIFPELVNGEKDGEQFQSVNYIGLIPILIKEIQELKKEIKLVKTELNELKNK